MRHIRCVFLSAWAMAMIAGSTGAMAQGPRAIYSSVAGQANRAVPGGGGLLFTAFDRPQPSPSGGRWIMLTTNDSGNTANDRMYLTGQGDAGTLRIREGVTELEPGRTPEAMSDRRAGILDDGRFGVTLNLTGATTDDAVAATGSTVPGFTIALREGQSIGSLPGINFGSGISDANLTGNGKMSVRATSLSGATSTTNAAVLRDDGNSLGGRSGTTIPTGQSGVAQSINTFSFGSYYVDETGANWLYKCDLNGPAATNQALVRNTSVVLQEGSALGGVGGTISNIISSNMSASGDWYARGETTTDQPWIVRNGAVVAQAGANVPGGISGETWSNSVWNVANGNTFGLHTGNRMGDFLLGGFTSNPDASRQYAIVLNNTSVVLREGDAVDLDGNGLMDDDAFFDVTGLTGASLNNKVDNFYLTDDLWMYGVIDLRNGAGASIGEAFVRLQVPTPGGAALLLGMGCISARRRR